MDCAKTINKKKMALSLIVKTILYAFAIFGLLFILILGAVAIMVGPKLPHIAGIPENTVLEIDFNQNYTESRGDDFFAEFDKQATKGKPVQKTTIASRSSGNRSSRSGRSSSQRTSSAGNILAIPSAMRGDTLAL